MAKETLLDVVSTVSNTQCLHIDDFICALLNVDEIYYTYTTQKQETKMSRESVCIRIISSVPENHGEKP